MNKLFIEQDEPNVAVATYEAPRVEVIEIEIEGVIASSGHTMDFTDGGDAW